MAVDRRRLASSVYHGFALADDDMVPPRSPYHTNDASFRPSGDVPQAARLLDAAGWKLGSDGVRQRDGKPLAITLTTQAGYAAIVGAAVQVQAMWHALGIEVELRPLLSNMLYSAGGPMQSGNFAVAIVPDGYATSPDRADTLTTSGFPPGRNYSRYSNRDMDAWTAQARVTDDFAKRRALYSKISFLLRRDAPLRALLWQKLVYVYNGKLHGLKPETVNSDMWNAYDWTLAP
jgi:peptide/nickel transport system substrate-binding protein